MSLHGGKRLSVPFVSPSSPTGEKSIREQEDKKVRERVLESTRVHLGVQIPTLSQSVVNMS